MGRPRHTVALAPFIVLLATTQPRPARAQSPVAEEHPLVERVTLNGVNELEADDIQSSIATQPTTCRAFFLKPLCALTHNHIFENREKLDHGELKQDVLRIKVFYWLRGFRHTQVDTVVAPRGRGVEVTFNISEGPATRIERLNIAQSRDVLSRRQLRRFRFPTVGDRIDLTRLDTIRAHVRTTLWDRGYGNAFLADTVTPIDSLRVALSLQIHPGPLTTVDTVVVEGNEDVTARTVRRLVGLPHGSLYKRADLLEAQRRLFRSELFRQALISSPDSADSAKTVLVSVREAPMRWAQVGGGLNTVEFGQVQGNLTLYNFIGSARRVDLRSTVGNIFAPSLYGKSVFGSAVPRGVSDDVDRQFLTPTWQLSASVTQPWLFSTKNSFGVSAFSNRRVIPNIVIDRGTGGSVTFTHTFVHNLPLSLTYRYERARVEAGQLYFCVNFGYCKQNTIGALQETNSLSPLILSLRADRTDDPLQPKSGYTALFDAQHASGMTGSNWRYNRIEAEFAWYQRLGTRVLVLRGHAGRVNELSNALSRLRQDDDASAQLLHPRVRFYGGGARSVRGFAEGQLGPRVLTVDPQKLIEPSDSSRGAACTMGSIADGSCDPGVAPSNEFVPRPVGGNLMYDATIEYRIPLSKTLGGAVFVDAGRVGGNNLGELLRSRSAVTPGIGFRYTSPIGPVRVDLGVRPGTKEELRVVTQTLDEDGELRLVELATPKLYDPSEGRSGIAKLFSRLQLHIYIGEAY